MATKATSGTLYAGNVRGAGHGGFGVFVKSSTVARTDTTAKNLFTLPKGAVVRDLTISSATASNAGTSASLSVGKTGTNTHFVNAYDVKTAGTGAGQQHPAASNMGSVGTSQIQVVGIYAEGGTASSAGGPWTVNIFYTLPG